MTSLLPCIHRSTAVEHRLFVGEKLVLLKRIGHIIAKILPTGPLVTDTRCARCEITLLNVLKMVKFISH